MDEVESKYLIMNDQKNEKMDSKKQRYSIPNEDRSACILKCYNELEFKLCDVIEVVGIISRDSSGIHSRDDIWFGEEKTEPQDEIIPQIHCIFAKKFENAHPLIDTSKLFITC